MAACETITDVLISRAELDPERIAYSFLEGGVTPANSVTFAQLKALSESIAAQMSSFGLKPGDRVLLVFPPGIDFIVTFYGALRCGVVAVPVAIPSGARHAQHIQAIAQDCAASAIAVSTDLLASLRSWIDTAGRGARLISFADLSVRTEACHERMPRPEQVAFLQYTSGSTGFPKGVVIKHSALMANSESIRIAFEHDASSTFVSWLPHFHDMGLVGSIVQPLYIGAASYLMAPLDFLRRPFRWLKAVDTFGAKTSGGPNFAYDLCVDRITDEERALLDLSQWRVAFCGAEPIRARTLERFADRFRDRGFSSATFFPCYGMAENTVYATGGPPRREPRIRSIADSHGARDLVSCGRPGADMQVRIVSPETRTTVADGDVGEVWVGGRSKCAEYFGRADESRERLEAYTACGQGPFLRTGDIGLIVDEELYVSGRISEMIIVRGRNLFSEDLEEACMRALSLGSAGRCAAFSGIDDNDEYIVVMQELPRSFMAKNYEDLAARISEALYKEFDVAPGRVVFVRRGQIPVTSSGKTRRRECYNLLQENVIKTLFDSRRFDGPRLSLAGRGRMPFDVIKSAIGRPYSDGMSLLTLPQLGFDSVRLAALEFELDRRFGVHVPVNSMMTESLREIASRFDAEVQLPQETEAYHSARSSTSDNEDIPSVGQSAFVALNSRHPSHRRYTIAFALMINNVVSAADLESALRRLCTRHPQLRLRSHNGRVTCTSEEPITRTVVRDLAKARSCAATCVAEPLNLNEGALARFDLYQTRAEVFIAVRLHHYVCDLWSLDVLIDELGRTLTGVPLSASAPYAEFVRWQDQYLASTEGQRAQVRWQERLSGALPVLELPRDYPRPPEQSLRAGFAAFTLSPQMAAHFYNFVRERGLTPFALFASVYSAVLGRYGACDDLIIGCPAHGRPDARFSGTVGLFTTTLPLRITIDWSRPFDEHVRRVAKTIQDALADQFVPLASIAERLRFPRSGAVHSIFQAMLTVQSAPSRAGMDVAAGAVGQPDVSIDLRATRARLAVPPPRAIEVDIDTALVADGVDLTGYIGYNADVFTEETAKQWWSSIEAALGAALADPMIAIGDLPLLSASERDIYFRRVNSPFEYDASTRIEDLFSRQAKNAPSAIAVVEANTQHDYGSLAAHSGAIADALNAIFANGDKTT